MNVTKDKNLKLYKHILLNYLEELLAITNDYWDAATENTINSFKNNLATKYIPKIHDKQTV